jgi:hypothetical protein
LTVPNNTGYVSWTLQDWQAAADGVKFLANYNIPGQPVGFASNGSLLVRENGTVEEPLRLDLLSLDANGDARLRDSLTLPCPAYYSNTLLQGDTLYLSCSDYGSGFVFAVEPTSANNSNNNTSKVTRNK